MVRPPPARHSRRSGLTFLLLSALGLTPQVAKAGDWVVTTSLSQTILATDNIEFDIDDRIPAIGSNTSVGLNVQAHSHLYDFSLSGSWGYQVYFGENQDVPDPEYIPSLSTQYTRRAKDLTFVVGASYSYTPGEDRRGVILIPGEVPTDPNVPPTDDEVLLSTTDSNADAQVVSANTSIAYKINTTNNLKWNLNGSRIDFFGEGSDDATPSTSAGTGLTWIHNRTRRVDLNLSTGVNWYSYENDENQVEYVYSLTAGFTNRVSPRLTVSGNLGVQLLDSYQDEATGMLPPDDFQQTHKTDLGGTGNLSLNYKLKSGSLIAGLSYGLTPDDDGELSNALTATVGYNHRINDRSSFNIGAGYQLSDSEVDGVLSNTNLSVSPFYSYAISKDWNLGLGYTFTYQDSEDGAATENSVRLTVSRSYTLLP